MNYLFDKNWFQQHQRGLLFLCNAPVIKYWFRWVLRIHHNVPFSSYIYTLEPNSYTIYLGVFLTKKGLCKKYKRDFRTHNKFSKRLYHAFYPLWVTFHIWDLFADHYAPKLSFGFSTLTVYPDPSTGATTVDGMVGRNNVDEVWASLRGGAGNASDPTGQTAQILIATAPLSLSQWSALQRAIFLFDTSSLGSTAIISAATLTLHASTKIDSEVITPDIDIYTSTPAANNTLANSDYAQLGTTSQTGSPVTYANWPANADVVFTLNSTGRGNISKTSITKFGARNANYDAANIEPFWTGTGLSSYLEFYTADRAGTTSDPHLDVTYTLPATSGGFFAAV